MGWYGVDTKRVVYSGMPSHFLVGYVSEADHTCHLEPLVLVTLSFVVKDETKLGEGAGAKVEISDLSALLVVTPSPNVTA